MKLEVGMYVRLINNDGMFGKIISITNLNNNFVEVQFQNIKMEIPTFFIKKASHNIIDLIEVGDYVNGVEVEEITNNEIMLVDTHLYIDKSVANDLIETILTKEQFENDCYKIGE